ncbi:ammonium transporter [Elysia marginata]|uniref:Ammonium transporter n=1 Tax=Elysia marginata TaxID=1093978 RepID=A0AAV4I8H8_9GAST|nr:ammonium transporter [Elysia marginata]
MSNNTTTVSPYLLSTEESQAARDARTWDDATWILTSAFIIFTMQSGFGLLESGSVSSKNEVNIMAKNVADVVFGGISYWMLGYGLSFGDGKGTNGFCGMGKFFIDPDDSVMGEEFSRFVFQSSFATTATTIVSGAVAERTKFIAYIIFSFFNTFVFCFPAHWVWASSGWLFKLGVVDVAGDGPVHLVGGVTSLVATIMIKPRRNRFTPEDDHDMGSPTGALLGLFTLCVMSALQGELSKRLALVAFCKIVKRKKMGFPQHLISMIASLYHNQKATIRWNNANCEPFNIEKGVRQGCILSPHLFNLYTEQIMRQADIDDMGINIGGRDITNLRYADDTALLSDNLTSMKRILHRVNNAGQQAGLLLNAKKNKGYAYTSKQRV